MKVDLDAAGGELRLLLSSRAAIGELFRRAEAEAGLFVELERELPQFHRLYLEARARPAIRFRCSVEVLQVFPSGSGFGTALRLVEWTPERQRQLQRALDGGGETDESVSPAFRIRQLNPNERFRLATRATRNERQILLRDTSPQVLMGLLSHPRLETQDVVAIIKSPHSSAGVLKRIAENRKWMMHPEVRTAVVRNQKTPTPLAIRLLDRLRSEDLRWLSKLGNTRESLRRAALRVYLQRTGRR